MSTVAVRSRAPWWALAALVLAGSTAPASAQCTNTSAFGTATISSTGALVTITTCAFAGEYSTINGAVSGQNLTVASSIPTDFVTIRSGTSNGPVVAFGTTPVSFANTFTGTLYAHWNTNAACGTQSSCRAGTVQCTNCTPPPAPANDACANAIAVGSPSATPGTTVSATSDAVPTCVTTLNTAPGVWYSFTPCASGTFTASLCGAGYDTKIGVFTGGCGGLACVAGNDDFCSLQSQATFSGTAGTTYLILVTGFSANSGAFTLNMTGNDLCNTCSLTCPANQVASTATDACVATVTYPAPTAAGNCGTVTCTPPSGGTFNLGTTPVGCTAALNGGACGFSVTVNDTQPPTIAPQNVVGFPAAAGTCAANVAYGAVVSDNCPGVGTAGCTPASGSSFPVGTTPTSCTVLDAAGNSASASGSVQVVDTQPPTVDTPDVTAGTDPGVCTAVVTFGATVSDNCPGVAVATCNPASGTAFALGTTPVTCSTTDAAGNPGSDPGSVTVSDDEDPVLAACPGDLFLPIPPGAQSTTLDFGEPAFTDNCSPAGVATCVPAPGDSVPVGTTAVACSATDGSGNDATCAFDVVVGNQTIQEIPAASTLGLAALALLLGAAAFVALRRGA
jgi:hypothetical protein